MLCSGCAVGHLFHLAVGQTRLLLSQQPLEEALQDPRLTPQQRDKIHLIQDVRQFAILHLGLHNGATYTTFVFLDAPYVSYTLTAAPKDALRPYVWWYPIVGNMPYRGFFRHNLALRAERRLQAQGYDTYVRGVRAYSTLGYFNDPILSSMLSYHDFDLIDTIIHEMLHQTVWIKSSVSFNESLASFVGEKGALMYLTRHYGAEAPERQQYLDYLADVAVFQEYMQELVTRVEALYQEPISREEKLQRREQLFAEAIIQYPTVFPRMKTTRYQRFFEHRPLNNALLMSFRVYNRDTSFFEQAFANHGGDLARMIAYFKTLRADQIPAKFRTH
jgi:predicted aminopeptidase